jgi:aryl-alcohol dehydrogenase-like predicted oxidoreductase
MDKRLFGRTGHLSSVAIFGGAAFGQIDQPAADQVMEMVLEAGVNHFDIAPSYGLAELRVGPWIPSIRQQIFLGCKTAERTRQAAAAEFKQSLQRLQTSYVDLYQIHGITTLAELDQVTAPGGALEALVEVRRAGLTRHLGITGHGYHAPAIFLEALRRFDFDSVLFPLNFIQYADPYFRQTASDLLAECRRRNVGVMIIKSITRGPWGEQPKTHSTWYQPFNDPEMIQQAVNFVLSQDVTGICTAGDVQVLPQLLHACQQFSPLTDLQQNDLIATAGRYAPLFTPA